jgi:hypothetical protein
MMIRDRNINIHIFIDFENHFIIVVSKIGSELFCTLELHRDIVKEEVIFIFEGVIAVVQKFQFEVFVFVVVEQQRRILDRLVKNKRTNLTLFRLLFAKVVSRISTS